MTGRVLVCGPALTARGGISAVIATHFRAAIVDPAVTDFVPTYVDGGRLTKGLVYAVAVLRVCTRLLVRRPAVLHLHSSSRSSFVRKAGLALLAGLARVPVIFHLHNEDIIPWLRDEVGPRFRACASAVLDRAAVVVTLTPELGARLRTALPVRARMAVLPNPVALESAVLRPAARREGPFRVLFLGGLTPAKGFPDLLAAVAALAAAGLALELRCGGLGDPGTVAAAIDRHSLQSHVRLLGWLGDAERLRELADADVLVLPSYTEGQPMVLIEAMMVGTPIVASAVGGVPDTVADGVEALLVRAGDVTGLAAGIRRVHDDPALAARLSAAGRRRAVAVHAPAAVRERLRAIYQDAGFG